MLPFIHRGFLRHLNIIRENWQFPEEYLREKKAGRGKKRSRKQAAGVLEREAQQGKSQRGNFKIARGCPGRKEKRNNKRVD